jgi:hypothetical protein
MTVFPNTTLATGVYRSYLVRFWQSTEQGGWRASAQCVQTSRTLLFGDVESLLAFLQQEFVKKETQETEANAVQAEPNTTMINSTLSSFQKDQG